MSFWRRNSTMRSYRCGRRSPKGVAHRFLRSTRTTAWCGLCHSWCLKDGLPVSRPQKAAAIKTPRRRTRVRRGQKQESQLGHVWVTLAQSHASDEERCMAQAGGEGLIQQIVRVWPNGTFRIYGCCSAHESSGLASGRVRGERSSGCRFGPAISFPLLIVIPKKPRRDGDVHSEFRRHEF